MPKKCLRFRHEKDADIANKVYEYEDSLTINEMLLDFLKQTNSKMTLDTDKICFVFGGILNTPRFLNRTIKEVFKKQNNVAILVKDPGDIVGGDIS